MHKEKQMDRGIRDRDNDIMIAGLFWRREGRVERLGVQEREEVAEQAREC